MFIKKILFPLFVFLLAGCIATPENMPEKTAVLVMAHGGSPKWNTGVLEVVEPLKKKYDVEVAFGMADAASIQEAVNMLENKGAKNILVVRLFISGESWSERTQQILGLIEGAPTRDDAEPGPSMPGMRMEFWKIDSEATFAMSKQGLSEAKEMDRVLLERARALSKNPAQEDVLILAHGPGDDEENARWLANMNQRASLLRSDMSFRRVEVATLREDWLVKRKEAEHSIRDYVERASRDGIAIVIPFRVNGFGPYAEVLEGLDYRADGAGLVPHASVTDWIHRQVEDMASAYRPHILFSNEN